MIKWIPVEKEAVPANKPHIIIRYEMIETGDIFCEFVETDEAGTIYYYQLGCDIDLQQIKITHWAECNEP